MAELKFSGKFSSKVDLGPFLNRTIDGFLTFGSVAAARVAAEETYHAVERGSVSHHNVDHALKKMCKEAAYMGTRGGVYSGMKYGLERIRGTKDWKNATIAAALTGALVSAANKNNRDKIVMDAITDGALATAAQFLI